MGAIGFPMAAQVARAHQLTVWNRTSARADAFAAEHGAVVASSPKELAQSSEILVTCLPSSAEVLTFLEGSEGALSGVREGTLLIDSTSGDPERSRRAAQLLAERGAAFVDAPVSGGVKGAEAGTLSVMMGGSESDVERARGVVGSFGRTMIHVGPVGSGHAIKAVTNALLATTLVALGEGLTAAVKAGVPPRTAVEVLNSTNSRSFVSQDLVPERVLTGDWLKTFRLSLLAKDTRNALKLLDSSGLPGPLLHLVGTILEAASDTAGEGADHVELIRLAEESAGLELRG